MHHERLVEPRMGNRAPPVPNVQERRLRERRQQLVGRVGGEDGRPLVVLGIAEHREAILVDRVEAGVGVPGLVEVDAIHAGVEQLLHPPGVVAEPVVGRVGDHRIDRPQVGPFGHQRVGLDGRRDRRLLDPFRRNRPDDPVAVPERDQVGRDPAGQHQAVLDRLVAVPVAERDLVAAHRRHADHPVRGRGPVGDAVGAMGPEDPGGVALVLAHGTGVVQQRAQGAHADREVAAEQVLPEIVEEDPPHRRLEKRGAAGVTRGVPGVLVFLAESHDGGRQRRQHHLDVALDRRHHPPTRRRRPCPPGSRRTRPPSPSRRSESRSPRPAPPSGRWGSCRSGTGPV